MDPKLSSLKVGLLGRLSQVGRLAGAARQVSQGKLTGPGGETFTGSFFILCGPCFGGSSFFPHFRCLGAPGPEQDF